MPRYKPAQRNGMFVPVVFEEQIQPGTFEFALHHLVDDELDLTALDAKFRNDATGASAYDPRVMLKIVLLAYSRGLITSRKIEAACEHNVAVHGRQRRRPPELHPHRQVRARTRPRDPGPVHPGADDLRPPGPDRAQPCSPSTASSCRPTPARSAAARMPSWRHRAERLEQAAAKIVALHQAQDEHGGSRPGCPAPGPHRRAAQRGASHPRVHRHAAPSESTARARNSRPTSPTPTAPRWPPARASSRAMRRRPRWTAQHQVIVAADIIGSGSEQAMLLPMIDRRSPCAKRTR